METVKKFSILTDAMILEPFTYSTWGPEGRNAELRNLAVCCERISYLLFGFEIALIGNCGVITLQSISLGDTICKIFSVANCTALCRLER